VDDPTTLDSELPFRLKWLTLFRAIATSALLVVVIGRLSVEAREPTSAESFGLGLAVVAYLATLVNGLLLRTGNVGPVAAWAQVGFDVVISFALVFVTGGTESPFGVLFSLATLGGSFLLRRPGAIVALVGSAIAWVLVAVLLSRGAISSRQVGELSTQFVALGLVAFLAQAISETLKGTRGRLIASEADVKRLEAQRQLIVNAMPSGLVTCDAKGLVVFMNPAGEQILGLSASDWSGKPLEDLLPGAAKRRVGRRGEQTLLTPQGRRTLGLTVTALDVAEPGSLLVVFQDLSAVRSLERELKAIDGLANLGRVSAQLAHEVRNPLSSMRGAAQLLESDLVGAPQKMAKLIVRECDRLAGLVEDYLGVARPPRPSLALGRLDLVVAETLELMRADPLVHATQLEEVLGPVQCCFDPAQVKQVVINLVRNAAQVTGPSGIIRVSVSEKPAPQVTVWDSAGAIAPEMAGRLFEPFATTKEGGMGLGLSMAMSIVQAHGGTIDVDSAPTRGTSFTVRFPPVQGDR
jgi:two-component system, NtrC family, sensor histidine kinase PilS